MVSGKCSKNLIYEVTSNLVKGLWRNGFGQTDVWMDGQTDAQHGNYTHRNFFSQHNKKYHISWTTLWEKEESVTSNFSISHVFLNIIIKWHQKGHSVLKEYQSTPLLLFSTRTVGKAYKYITPPPYTHTLRKCYERREQFLKQSSFITLTGASWMYMTQKQWGTSLGHRQH